MKKTKRILASILALPLAISMCPIRVKAWDFPTISNSYIETQNNLLLTHRLLIALCQAGTAADLPAELLIYLNELEAMAINLLDPNQTGTAAEFLDKALDIFHGVRIVIEYLKTPYKEQPELLKRKKLGAETFDARRYLREFWLPDFDFLQTRGANASLKLYRHSKYEERSIRTGVDVIIGALPENIRIAIDEILHPGMRNIPLPVPMTAAEWDWFFDELKNSLASLYSIQNPAKINQKISDSIEEINQKDKDYRASELMHNIKRSYSHVRKGFDELPSREFINTLSELPESFYTYDFPVPFCYKKVLKALQEEFRFIERFRFEASLLPNGVPKEEENEEKYKLQNKQTFHSLPFVKVDSLDTQPTDVRVPRGYLNRLQEVHFKLSIIHRKISKLISNNECLSEIREDSSRLEETLKKLLNAVGDNLIVISVITSETTPFMLPDIKKSVLQMLDQSFKELREVLDSEIKSDSLFGLKSQMIILGDPLRTLFNLSTEL